MTTVKTCLAQKPQPLFTISVRSGEKGVQALQLMRDNRVRAVLVINDNKLAGIITQGDCAIK